MITCKLRDKTYSVDYITGRALREIEGAVKMLAMAKRITDRIAEGQEPDAEDTKYSLGRAMDEMVRWFCILFGNQFTPAEVYDNYPNDQLMHDIAMAIMAVQLQTTEGLSEFPMRPTANNSETL